MSYGHQDAMVGPNLKWAAPPMHPSVTGPAFLFLIRKTPPTDSDFLNFSKRGEIYLACISVKKNHPNLSVEASLSIRYFYVSKAKKTISGPRWCLILKPERKCCSSAISHQSPLWVSFFWRPRKHFQTLSLPAGRGSFPRNITSSPRGDNRGEAAVKQSI